jgi:predicted DNA-binding transcriptional regulator YafY
VDLAAESARRSVGQWAQIEEVGADRCRLRMTVDNLDWTPLALGSFGAEFAIVNPPELLERVHEWASRFGRARRALSAWSPLKERPWLCED